MVDGNRASSEKSEVTGPPIFNGFDHVSVPCRDLEDGVRFYVDVLGGELVVKHEKFALFKIAETRIGIGSVGGFWISAFRP